MERDTQYWASKSGPDFTGALVEKVEDYYDFLRSSGLYDLWSRSHMMYAWGTTENVIRDIGRDGQFKALRINHYRNILRHLYVGTTGQRPTYKPVATNTDYNSRAQARVCEGALEYYDTRKRGVEYQNQAAEYCLVVGEGYRFKRWDPNAGKAVDVDMAPPTSTAEAFDQTAQLAGPAYSGRPVYEGDIVEQALHPIDVIRDTTRDRWDGMPWVIIRTRANRFDLAALYPEQAQRIMDAEDLIGRENYENRIRLIEEAMHNDTDEVYVYTFIHDRRPSMPGGRWTTFLDAEAVLQDTTLDQLKVEELDDVLIRMSGGEIEGIPFGYTLGFDLQAPQDALNIAMSTAMTHLANGDQILTGPAGSSAQMTQLGNGVRFVALESIREGRIEVLDLMRIPDVLFKFSEMVIGSMETMSGVNSVTRGNPEASLKSGTALALVQSQFLQFTQDYQAAFAHMYERAGTAQVRIFRNNVPEDRLAAIVGKGNAAYVRALKAEDLSNIDRVTVDMGPYLSRTAAGRVNLAEQLLGAGLLKNASDFMYVLENGRLDGALHDETDELMLIELENEKLQAGQVPAQMPEAGTLIVDNDPLHIQKHKKVLFSPEAREQPEVVIATVTHIQWHINNLMTKDPMLAAVIGQPAPGAPGGQPAPAVGGPVPGPQPGAPDQPPTETAQIGVPNPVTGEPAEVAMPGGAGLPA
jgi:hypothetical protein